MLTWRGRKARPLDSTSSGHPVALGPSRHYGCSGDQPRYVINAVACARHPLTTFWSNPPSVPAAAGSFPSSTRREDGHTVLLYQPDRTGEAQYFVAHAAPDHASLAYSCRLAFRTGRYPRSPCSSHTL